MQQYMLCSWKWLLVPSRQKQQSRDLYKKRQNTRKTVMQGLWTNPLNLFGVKKFNFLFKRGLNYKHLIQMPLYNITICGRSLISGFTEIPEDLPFATSHFLTCHCNLQGILFHWNLPTGFLLAAVNSQVSKLALLSF